MGRRRTAVDTKQGIVKEVTIETKDAVSRNRQRSNIESKQERNEYGKKEQECRKIKEIRAYLFVVY
jgi:hypothetical protein